MRTHVATAVPADASRPHSRTGRCCPHPASHMYFLVAFMQKPCCRWQHYISSCIHAIHWALQAHCRVCYLPHAIHGEWWCGLSVPRYQLHSLAPGVLFHTRAPTNAPTSTNAMRPPGSYSVIPGLHTCPVHSRPHHQPHQPQPRQPPPPYACAPCPFCPPPQLPLTRW